MVGSGNLLAQVDVRPLKLMRLRAVAQQSFVALACGPAVTIRLNEIRWPLHEPLSRIGAVIEVKPSSERRT